MNGKPNPIDPRTWLGDGGVVRIASSDDGGVGRDNLEDSGLYPWFFDHANRIDILGIACTKFISVLSNGVEYAERGDAELRKFLEWIRDESYIGRNLLGRHLFVRIAFLSPDSEYIKLRRLEGDYRCRDNILRTIGRLRCLERVINSGHARFADMKGRLEVELISRNPCFSVFRANLPDEGQLSAYSGAIVGIIGQAQDVKSFPAIWVPAQSPATATLVADHLAHLRAGAARSRLLFRWDSQGCKLSDWTRHNDAFLSYNHADKEIVEDLHHRLEAMGLRCFLDARGGNSAPGVDWEQNIKEALQQTKCAVVCVGQSGLGQWQETRELVYLLAYKRSDVTVIPVSLCGARCPTLPGNLALDRANSFQFDPARDFELSVRELVDAIHQANEP